MTTHPSDTPPATGPVRVIGQREIRLALRRAWESQRLGHAFLLHGARGIGKLAVVLEFANTLVCEDRTHAPCGTCAGCTLFAAGRHPDVLLALPAPAKATPEELSQARLVRMRKPYDAFSFGKKADITIDRIREVQAFAGLRPFRAPCRVCIIDEADRMNKDAANALLKILEEPPPDLTFLLTAHDRGRLLPTILSRCIGVRCAPLTMQEIRAGLAGMDGATPEHIDMAAAMAEGSLLEARRYMESGLEERQRMAAMLLEKAAEAGNPLPLEVLEEMSRQHDPDYARDLLRMLLLWVGQALREQAGQAPKALPPEGPAAQVMNRLRRLPAEGLQEMAAALENSIDLTHKNVYIFLIWINLLKRIRLYLLNIKS